MENYVPPALKQNAFNCPHCGAYAAQYWLSLRRSPGVGSSGWENHPNSFVSTCSRCKNVTIWIKESMVYPSTGSAPIPNSDMPDDIKDDYNEARDICLRSPRSACILLRLCVENICASIGAKGRDLNAMIGDLVKQKKLDGEVINALDSIRVIGGQAAHPLELDLRTDKETAEKLFNIVNYISDSIYTRPKKIQDMFGKVPEDKKEAIKQRDSK